MAKDRSLVRASDIGAWTFCHRAWWLAQVQGVPHQRPEQLARGDIAHRQHGQLVRRTHRFQRAGLALIALSVITMGLILSIWILSGA